MKLTIDDIFRNCYSLTIDDDQFKYQCDVFEYYGLPKPTKFQGLYKEPNGPLACLIGHLSLIMMARALKLPYITVFEDDAYPCIEIKKELNHYLSNIPDNCGILCYGYNAVVGTTEIHGEFEIFRERPYGSHAYTIFESAYDNFIDSLEKQRIVDIALRGNNFKDANKPYWITKYLFVQKNIDNNRMSGSSKPYIYPNPETRRLNYSNSVPDRFIDKIPGITIQYTKKNNSNLNNRYYVEHYTWRGWCTIDTINKTIDHGGDHGQLLQIGDGKYLIKWDRWNNSEILISYLDTYKIIKN